MHIHVCTYTLCTNTTDVLFYNLVNILVKVCYRCTYYICCSTYILYNTDYTCLDSYDIILLIKVPDYKIIIHVLAMWKIDMLIRI